MLHISFEYQVYIGLKKCLYSPDSLIEDGDPVDVVEFVLEIVEVEHSETDLRLHNAVLYDVFNVSRRLLKKRCSLFNCSRCT